MKTYNFIYNDTIITPFQSNISFNIGDIIIFNNIKYCIINRTINLNGIDNCESDIIQCNCELIGSVIETLNFYSLLENIYNKSYLTTSGINTNEIENNPKIIILMIIAGLIIEPDHFKQNNKLYRTNIIEAWNIKKLYWQNIFPHNPPVSCDNINIIKESTEAIITRMKISKHNLPWNNL